MNIKRSLKEDKFDLPIENKENRKASMLPRSSATFLSGVRAHIFNFNMFQLF